MKIRDTFDNTEVEVVPVVRTYGTYSNMCLELETADTHEAYATLTTNIEDLPDWYAAVDTNNHPEAPEFIKTYGLGVDTGKRLKSGYCEYPVYQFFADKLKDFMLE